jgi:hypothetical protein
LDFIGAVRSRVGFRFAIAVGKRYFPTRDVTSSEWHHNSNAEQIAAGNSRCPCQLRLIYEICLSSFHSTSRSAAVPELWTLGVSNYARYHHIRIQLAIDWMQPKAAADRRGDFQ